MEKFPEAGTKLHPDDTAAVFEIFIKTTPERLWEAITDPELPKDGLVEIPSSVGRHGADRQLGGDRRAKLARDDDVELAVERTGHFRRHRNAPTRNPEHEGVLAAIGR